MCVICTLWLVHEWATALPYQYCVSWIRRICCIQYSHFLYCFHLNYILLHGCGLQRLILSSHAGCKLSWCPFDVSFQLQYFFRLSRREERLSFILKWNWLPNSCKSVIYVLNLTEETVCNYIFSLHNCFYCTVLAKNQRFCSNVYKI